VGSSLLSPPQSQGRPASYAPLLLPPQSPWGRPPTGQGTTTKALPSIAPVASLTRNPRHAPPCTATPTKIRTPCTSTHSRLRPSQMHSRPLTGHRPTALVHSPAPFSAPHSSRGTSQHVSWRLATSMPTVPLSTLHATFALSHHSCRTQVRSSSHNVLTTPCPLAAHIHTHFALPDTRPRLRAYTASLPLS
jgi:hypothetical protein